MHSVEPIRDLKKLNLLKEYLKKNNFRNYLLFLLGINSGLRISDLLLLKVNNIKDKEYIEINEKKTGKYKRFPINRSIKKPLFKFISNKSLNEYLFTNKKNRPLSRVQAYRIIKDACMNVGIADCIGTHSLRKTFGYHFYKKNKDIALLQQILNHSTPQITLRYIGINQDILDVSLRRFAL